MDIDEIINCAEALAKMLGLRIHDKKRLKKNINRKIPITTFFYNEKFTLWVDRYFIAYSRSGYLDVWYIYITKENISEELQEIKALMKYKTDFLWYIQLSNLREQMREALRQMRVTGMGSYIFYDNLNELQRVARSDL